MQFESKDILKSRGWALLSTYNKYYSSRWEWLFLGSNKWGEALHSSGEMCVSVENVVGVFLTQNDPNMHSHSAFKIFKMCHNKFQS